MSVRRPALPDVAGPLVAAGALLALIPLSGWAALAIAVATSLRVRQPARRWTALGSAAALLAGWGAGSARLHVLDADPLASRVGHALVGARVVVDEPWHGGGFGRSALGHVLGAGGGSVLLRITGADGPDRGSILLVSGSLERPRGPRDGFDERAWLARQGVRAVLRVRDLRTVGRRGGLLGMADRLRTHALHALEPAGTGDAAHVAVGLALGGSAGLGRPAVEAFRASGLAHLLAVSGGNIALLVALVAVLVWLAGGSRRLAMGVALVAIAAYVGVVGGSASVVRAGIGGAIGCLVWLLGRPRDAWRALGLALGVLLAWNPRAIGDPGLQLSFAAVAGILLVAPHIRPWAAATRLPVALLAAIAVTGAATLATAPISWWHFGRATILAAIPANLLAAPAVPLAVWSALLAIVVTPIAPGAGAGIAWCAQWPAAWILECAWIGAALADRTPAWLLPCVAALGLAGLAARRRH